MLNKRFFLIICLIVSTIFAEAQTRISSPYSRYGIGDLQKGRFGHNLGLTGLNSAFRNEATINYINPASYTAFDTNSFVFDVGLNSYFNSLQTNNVTEYYNYTTLGYLLFGFPVNKWWGSSFGLVPFSNTGYNILNSDKLDSIGNINYLYEGKGGINRFYWGNSFELFKNFSAGVNVSILFGSMDKIRSAVFVDSDKIFDVRIKNYTIVNDINLDWGLQYEHTLKSGLNLCVGSSFGTSSKLNAKQNTIAERFNTGSTGYEVIEDTVYNITGEKGHLMLPSYVNGGFLIKNNEKWMAGADIGWQNWSDYNSFGVKDSLKNSLQASIGFAFVPSLSSIATYFKKVQYRFGVHYGNSYLQLKNTQINEFGISFGLGLPLKRSKSIVNLGIELGQRGTKENNLIREQYGRITFGFSIHEKWFLRKKYD